MRNGLMIFYPWANRDTQWRDGTVDRNWEEPRFCSCCGRKMRYGKWRIDAYRITDGLPMNERRTVYCPRAASWLMLRGKHDIYDQVRDLSEEEAKRIVSRHGIF